LEAKYLLVYSKVDPAGLNIKNQILNLNGTFKQLRDELWYSEELNALLGGFPEDILYINYLDKLFNVETYIFLSRHSSEKAVKSLTAHHTGNVTFSVSHGARARELSYTNPRLLKTIMLSLKRYAEELNISNEYEVTLEVTHHGPTELKRPIIFVEIGSRIDDWENPKAGECIGRAVLEALSSKSMLSSEWVTALGFGGGHYARKHTKLELESNICYSHIFSKYMIGHVDEEIVQQAVKKTLEGCGLAILEKKSIKASDRRRLVEILQRLQLEVKYI